MKENLLFTGPKVIYGSLATSMSFVWLAVDGKGGNENETTRTIPVHRGRASKALCTPHYCVKEFPSVGKKEDHWQGIAKCFGVPTGDPEPKTKIKVTCNGSCIEHLPTPGQETLQPLSTSPSLTALVLRGGLSGNFVEMQACSQRQHLDPLPPNTFLSAPTLASFRARIF